MVQVGSQERIKEHVVDQSVDLPVSQSVERIVDDPMPQVVADSVVEQIVDVRVLLRSAI